MEKKQEEQNNNLAEVSDKAQDGKIITDHNTLKFHFDDTKIAANEEEIEKGPEKGKSVRKAESKIELKVKKSLAKQSSDPPRLSKKSNRGRRPLQIEEYVTRSNAKVAAWRIELTEMRKTRP